MTLTNDKNHLYAYEASILGAIFLDNSLLAQFPRLESSDFSHAKYRAVFSAMRNLEAKNQPIDVVTVHAQLVSAGFGEVVDIGLLGELTLSVPSVTNAIEYVRHVRSASLGRRVRIVLGEILAQPQDLEGAELLSMTMAALSRIDEDQPDPTVSIDKLVAKRFKQLEQIAADRASGKRTMTGFPTGIAALDEKIGGVQPGIVTIIAARPGHGKSSEGLAIADASSAAGFGVHLFSLEDTEESYADRTIARTSDVPAEALRNATLTTQQCRDIAQGYTKVAKRRWLVDGRSGITADEIVRSVRRHRKSNGTCVVIVDYVQLVKTPPGSRLSRHEALTEIVTTFADAAKHDGLAYVVMSQLNRQLEQRTDKRPQLADLRESGSLEERAKCVIGLYRGSVYGEPTKGIDWDPDWEGHSYCPTDDEFAHQIQIGIIKNSNGRTGTVFAYWNGPTTTIS